MPAKHLAIIPCRKGSKSIKDKNLQKIGEKTLVRIAYEKAYKSQVFDKIIITTDYNWNMLGIEDLPTTGHTSVEVLRRPDELCTDEALMKDVVSHTLNHVGKQHKWVWILQPTSPYGEIDDIKKIKKILDNHDSNPDKVINSLISLKPCKDHPDRTYTIKHEGGFPEACRQRWTNFKNKEDLMDKQIRSGNYYVFDREEFLKSGEFYNKVCYAYLMNRVDGLNIDEQEDLQIAKWYYNIGKKKLKI